jgi:hypothetical protein
MWLRKEKGGGRSAPADFLLPGSGEIRFDLLHDLLDAERTASLAGWIVFKRLEADRQMRSPVAGHQRGSGNCT